MVVDRKMFNCEQVWQEISNYVDGEVDAGAHTAMQEHFKTCPRCKSLLAGTRNVVKLYGDERMLEVPAGFSQRLEKRIEKGLAGRLAGGRARWSTWSTWLIPAAAVVLIAGAVWMTNSFTFRNFVRSHHAEPAFNIPPDLKVVVSGGSKLFHLPGCKFIKDPNSERTMTAQEAMGEGYVPCTRCLRQYLKTQWTRPGADDGNESNDEAEEQELRAGGITQ